MAHAGIDPRAFIRAGRALMPPRVRAIAAPLAAVAGGGAALIGGAGTLVNFAEQAIKVEKRARGAYDHYFGDKGGKPKRLNLGNSTTSQSTAATKKEAIRRISTAVAPSVLTPECDYEKFHDFDVFIPFINSEQGGQVVTAGWWIVPQGTAHNERIGRQVVMTSLQIRGSFQTNGYKGDDSPVETLPFGNDGAVRILILVDTQANDASPGIAEILSLPTEGSGRTWINGSDMLNPHNTERFIVLRDEYKMLRGINYQATAGFSDQITMYGSTYPWMVDIDMDFVVNYPDETSSIPNDKNLLIVMLLDDNAFSVQSPFSGASFTPFGSFKGTLRATWRG